MKPQILQEMLLIQDPSVFKLYREILNIATYFVAPSFTIALILEYFGKMDFGSVVKKLLIITLMMTAFYKIHTEAVTLAFQGATETISKVNSNNLFIKKWYETKVTTRHEKNWNFLESFAIPNLNDLVATAFFVFAKVFIWMLKLIYSTVYHLTYVFAPITAILYFFGWTSGSLKGSVQASLWCVLMPFVVVAILVLVGNSIDQSAKSSELILADIDTIVWLFGVTLLLLLAPIITLGLVRGDGIHALGTQMGLMVIGAGMKGATAIGALRRVPKKIIKGVMK